MLKFIGFVTVLWALFHFGIAQAILLMMAAGLTWVAVLF